MSTSNVTRDLILALAAINKLYSNQQLKGKPLASFTLKLEFEGEAGYVWTSSENSARSDLGTAISLILNHPQDSYNDDFAPLYTLLSRLFQPGLKKSPEYVIAVEGDNIISPKLGIAASIAFVENLAFGALPAALELLEKLEVEEPKSSYPANVIPLKPNPTKH